jgi:hypothetical protein
MFRARFFLLVARIQLQVKMRAQPAETTRPQQIDIDPLSRLIESFCLSSKFNRNKPAG